jgi:hypothetical protein
VAPLAIPLALKFVVPSVYTTLNVPAGSVNVNGVLLPPHMVAVPAIAAVGTGLTVITALPVIFGLGAVTLQVLTVFETLTIEYVVFTAGLTFTVAPLTIPFALKFVVPSVYTTLKVPADRVKVSVAVPPTQIPAVPPMLAVGRGFTVMIALPVIFGLGADTVHVVVVLVTLTIV